MPLSIPLAERGSVTYFRFVGDPTLRNTGELEFYLEDKGLTFADRTRLCGAANGAHLRAGNASIRLRRLFVGFTPEGSSLPKRTKDIKLAAEKILDAVTQSFAASSLKPPTIARDTSGDSESIEDAVARLLKPPHSR